MGLSRELAAELLTQLVREKLRAAGLPDVATVTPDEITAWLQGKGKGIVGASSTSTSPMARGAVQETTARARATEEVNLEVKEKSETLRFEGKAEVMVEVQEVWAEWQRLRGTTLELDAKASGKIADRLAFGFTVDELKVALRRALENPALVKRTKITAISRPLESDERVCVLLQKPYTPRERVTWLTPFDKVWKEQYGTSGLAFGAFAKVATRLLAKHSTDEVLEEFEAYVQRTQIDFVSWPKFESGFGAWRTARSNQRGRDAHESASMVKGLW